MVLDFLKKFLLLSVDDQKAITHIRADVGRKREFNRIDGFIRTETEQDKTAMGFVYEPSLDSRISKLRRTGPYFRIWFKLLKNGEVYFVDFEKLNF